MEMVQLRNQWTKTSNGKESGTSNDYQKSNYGYFLKAYLSVYWTILIMIIN